MPASEVFVYTMNKIGSVGAWSRYLFPFPIDAFTQLHDDLYIRSGNDVLRVSESETTDFAGDSREQSFTGTVWWPWLDMGRAGVDKVVYGFDMVGRGTSAIEFGYNQASQGVFTTPFVIPADTVPGQIIPMEVMAPSFSVRVTYAGGEEWELQALNVYLNDMSMGA